MTQTTLTAKAKNSMWIGNDRELLVTAFIRQIEEIEIPTVIQSVVFRYYPKFENIEFKRYSRYYCSSLYDEGHTLMTNIRKSSLHCSRIFASNIGYNKNIHLWKIRYLNIKNVRGTYGSSTFGAIGIVTNIKSIKNNSSRKTEINSSLIGTSYYFDKHYKSIFGYLNGQKIDDISPSHFEDDEIIKTWYHNDEIVVLLNCDEWTLSFYVNEKHFVGTIQIKPYLMYYPVIQFYCPDDQYIVSEYV